ncbi:hypothetical protein GGR50DRAFT_690421 [Xylaria sp. CBS 124048]|nr:hypothetical protein GGR50DRAFT_690421 [Xylaria sp. CBS 124048]
MAPLMDCFTNLPEMLAVDLEQSSDIFRSRHLTAGAPAPGLADPRADTKPQRHSLRDHLSPTFPSQPASALPESNKSWQSIHQKYSDIFAPLDFNSSKRGSVSSTNSSADLEPPSVGTQGSVLTVDTYFDSEKAPTPAFIPFSPTSDTAQASWIDLDDLVTPVTPGPRSAMSTASGFTTQIARPPPQLTATRIHAMPSGSPVPDAHFSEGPTSPIGGHTLIYPSEIPRRRSSLHHQEAYAAAQQLAQHFNQTENNHESPSSTTTTGAYHDGPGLRVEDNAKAPFHEDNPVSPFTSKSIPTRHSRADSMSIESFTDQSDGSDNLKGPSIASAEVGFEEWLESDAAQIPDGDQILPRMLPSNIEETIKLYVTNFPDPMLMCTSLLIDSVRNLSHRIRYNNDGLRSDTLTVPGEQPQRHKISKWKWLGSSAQEQEQPDPALTYVTPEWAVMRKIFPHGSDDLCEALYAYILVYNYISSLCVRFPCPPELSRPTTPWAIRRPSTSRSTNGPDPGLFGPGPLQRPSCDANIVPLKAASVLGLGDEDIPNTPALLGVPRPSSRASVRASTFANLRGMFFGGGSQGQQRGENKDALATTRPTTPAMSQHNLSRPVTPAAGGSAVRPVTPTAPRGPESAKQLAELRHGLAMCCARLTVTLHRANPSVTKHKADKHYKVDPSFMRSLCEIVRSSEEMIGRGH